MFSGIRFGVTRCLGSSHGLCESQTAQTLKDEYHPAPPAVRSVEERKRRMNLRGDGKQALERGSREDPDE